ncbi:MAG: hypothetical protein E7Z92_03175 [Cyanobacteria bacterium SIG31]|nr:hypothetical protein [Cyanobacteria bacterium SIG31]
MTKDLTQEEIVTQILSSNEILRKQKENFYISNPEYKLGNLGLFLSKTPQITNINQKEKDPLKKYSFIRSKWYI